MGGLPDILFVIDTNKEAIAIAEAKKLNIAVVALIDSNSDPDPISYPIPGNDDAIRAINLYCRLMSDAVLDGIQEEMTASGVDVGATEDAPRESLPEEGAAVDEPAGGDGKAAKDEAAPAAAEPAAKGGSEPEAESAAEPAAEGGSEPQAETAAEPAAEGGGDAAAAQGAGDDADRAGDDPKTESSGG